MIYFINVMRYNDFVELMKREFVMNNVKKNFMKNLLAAAIMVFTTLTIVIGCIMTPIVEISHSTGNCVRVISNDSSHSCDNLPTRYDTVWVK